MKSSVSFRGEKLEKRKRQRMRRRRMCWKQMMWFWSPAWSCRTCPPLLRFLASVLSNKIFKLFQFLSHPIYLKVKRKWAKELNNQIKNIWFPKNFQPTNISKWIYSQYCRKLWWEPDWTGLCGILTFARIIPSNHYSVKFDFKLWLCAWAWSLNL